MTSHNPFSLRKLSFSNSLLFQHTLRAMAYVGLPPYRRMIRPDPLPKKDTINDFKFSPAEVTAKPLMFVNPCLYVDWGPVVFKE